MNLKTLLVKIASLALQGGRCDVGGRFGVPGLNPAVVVVGHRENVQLTFLKVSTAA